MPVISAIQYKPRLARCKADVSDNFRRCQEHLHFAGRIGSQLIVLPELCFTGYSFLNKEEVAEIAEPLEGPTFRSMRGVALELKSYVSWGFIEAAADGQFFNSASVVDPFGKLILTYRKINLWGNDFLWATSGAAVPPIVKTDLGYMSVVICRDIRDKYPLNIPRTASKDPSIFKDRHVDLVAAPTNWGKGGFPSNSWMNFAADNQCTLVVANRWGEETNTSPKHGQFTQDFGHGGSAVIDKNWSVHTNGLKFNQDCVVVACMEDS